MKYRLLDLLVDQSGKTFKLEASLVETATSDKTSVSRKMCNYYCGFHDCHPSEGVTIKDCQTCFSKEVISGTLISASDQTFLIEAGVPKLLFEVEKSTQKSFSLEWKYAKPDERNWGMSIQLREEKFLAATAMTSEKLRQSLMLDAGCGNGSLDEHLSSKHGVEIVALDQSTSPFSIQSKKPDFVYPIQASVMAPPLRKGAFDLIRSGGVLHHTPDTRKAFDQLIPLLKDDGRCYVWLYNLIDPQYYPNDYLPNLIYNWIGRNITSRLPHIVQEFLYLLIAIFYVVRQHILELLNRPNEKLTFGEKMQELIDRFSPRYAWRHSEGEVVDWFKSHGMSEIQISEQAKYGFGVRGVVKKFK